MVNKLLIEPDEAMEILLELKERRTFYFNELNKKEKAALNCKELIEDDYFIRLQHHQTEIEDKIDKLCPLNFFADENFQLVARDENDTQRCEILPGDTYLKVNNI